jgi:hypothetical protein
MTAILRRATSALLDWLGLDSASVRGFALGRPGTEWQTWSLRARLAPVTARASRPAPKHLATAGRVCR